MKSSASSLPISRKPSQSTMVEELANIYKNVTLAGGPGVANKDAGVQSPISATRFSSFRAHRARLQRVSEATHSWNPFTCSCPQKYYLRLMCSYRRSILRTCRIRMKRSCDSGFELRKPFSRH